MLFNYDGKGLNRQQNRTAGADRETTRGTRHNEQQTEEGDRRQKTRNEIGRRHEGQKRDWKRKRKRQMGRERETKKDLQQQETDAHLLKGETEKKTERKAGKDI